MVSPRGPGETGPPDASRSCLPHRFLTEEPGRLLRRNGVAAPGVSRMTRRRRSPVIAERRAHKRGHGGGPEDFLTGRLLPRKPGWTPRRRVRGRRGHRGECVFGSSVRLGLRDAADQDGGEMTGGATPKFIILRPAAAAIGVYAAVASTMPAGGVPDCVAAVSASGFRRHEDVGACRQHARRILAKPISHCHVDVD